MLEKRKNFSKKWITIFSAMALCICMSITAFAATRTGEICGLKYTFCGWYDTYSFLNGTTEANIYNNGYSYVKVIFQKNLVDTYTNTTLGIHGDKVTLAVNIKTGLTNWRVYHHAYDRENPYSTPGLSASGYSFY